MNRTLIAACTTMAVAGAAQAAGTSCDFTLTGGKVTSGKVISSTLKADVVLPGGTIPAGTKLTGGEITAGAVTAGVASGGKHVEARCSGAGVSKGALREATLARVTAALPEGAKEIATITGGSLADVELKDVNLDDPAGPFVAQKEPTTTTEDPALPLTGDWFKFKTQVNGIHLGEHPADKPPTKTGFRAPRNACFRVATEVTKTTGAEATKYARGTFYAPESNDFWTIVTSPTMWAPPYMCATADDYVSRHEIPDESERIDIRKTYDIPRELVVSDRDRYRNGFTYGVMVAPFKYYRESKTFDVGGTIGPYVGYRIWDRQGSSTVLAASVGATSTKMVKVDNGVSTEETKTGMSWALGILTEFKSAFNVGVLWGMDMFSAGDAVPKSGAHWVSISIGYKLAN